MTAVRDGLARLDGVHTIEIDLQTNDVLLRCGPDRAMDVAAVPDAIRAAGFRPADLELTAHGTVVASGVASGVALRPMGWTSDLPFDEPVAFAEGTGVRVIAAVTGWEEGGELELEPFSIEPFATDGGE